MLLHFFCLVCQHTPSSPLMASVRQRTEQRSLLLSPFTRPPPCFVHYACHLGRGRFAVALPRYSLFCVFTHLVCYSCSLQNCLLAFPIDLFQHYLWNRFISCHLNARPSEMANHFTLSCVCLCGGRSLIAGQLIYDGPAYVWLLRCSPFLVILPNSFQKKY